MSYSGVGLPGQVYTWTGTKFAWTDPIGLSPLAFALRAWWDIESAPANGTPVGTLWPVYAGNEGVPLVSNSTVVRGGTELPNGSVGVTSAFRSQGFLWADSANTPWTSVDGSLTMFSVSRAQALADGVLGAMGPLGNPNSGNTNIMQYASTGAGALRSEKNSFAGSLVVLASAAYAPKDDMAMVIVSTYSATRIDTTVLWDDGTVTLAGLADNTAITNAGGYTLNCKGDPAFPTFWTKPTVSAGVIGQGLTAGQRLSLARNLAARFNISGF